MSGRGREPIAGTQPLHFRRRRGARAYTACREARAKDREGALNDAALAELRRGCYLGPETFGRKLDRAPEQIGDSRRKRASVGGSAARPHDEQEALRLIRVGSALFGLPAKRRQ